MSSRATKSQEDRRDLSEALREADKVLSELIAEDPKLGMAKNEAQRSGVASEDFGESAARTYRQLLGR